MNILFMSKAELLKTIRDEQNLYPDSLNSLSERIGLIESFPEIKKWCSNRQKLCQLKKREGQIREDIRILFEDFSGIEAREALKNVLDEVGF